MLSRMGLGAKWTSHKSAEVVKYIEVMRRSFGIDRRQT